MTYFSDLYISFPNQLSNDTNSRRITSGVGVFSLIKSTDSAQSDSREDDVVQCNDNANPSSIAAISASKRIRPRQEADGWPESSPRLNDSSVPFMCPPSRPVRMNHQHSTCSIPSQATNSFAPSVYHLQHASLVWLPAYKK